MINGLSDFLPEREWEYLWFLLLLCIPKIDNYFDISSNKLEHMCRCRLQPLFDFHIQQLQWDVEEDENQLLQLMILAFP